MFGRRCVAPVLAQLVTDHPKLGLNISFSDRPVDLIEDGFDLAVRNGSIGAGNGLITRTVESERMTVCAGRDYLERYGRPASLEALTSHWAVIYSRAGSIRSWQFPTADGSLTEVTPPTRLRLDDLEAIAGAATAGHGLAWLPCWLGRDRPQAETLEAVLGHLPQVVFRTHALWPSGPHMPLRVRLALDATAAAFAGSTEIMPLPVKS
ncbi:LysR substrate-binding domain-containing protein [Neorhizobium sp. JUb45]|uniref:LysR substrate-binding domain-containing protein n=1 Tax=Neorhizobium sp. JUb45 TaxID=2485113 RepID=UPI001FE1600A|nr:LysR substrate-binding domain-containing protein [Neorhizobium sp. JUb45]